MRDLLFSPNDASAAREADLFLQSLRGLPASQDSQTFQAPRAFRTGSSGQPHQPRQTSQPTLGRVFDHLVHGGSPSGALGLAQLNAAGWRPLALPHTMVSPASLSPSDIAIVRAHGEGRLARIRRLDEIEGAHVLFGRDGRLRSDCLILRHRDIDAAMFGAAARADARSHEAIDVESAFESRPCADERFESAGSRAREADINEGAHEDFHEGFHEDFREGLDEGVQEADESVPANFLERRPVLRQADARWAPAADSPDHRHLLPATLSLTSFSLTPAILEALFRLNRFPFPSDTSRILFGLRACSLVGDVLSNAWASSVSVVEALPDHNQALCVLGVWDRPGRRITVFKGSTVPFWHAMETYRQGGDRCNLLVSGLYQYRIGTHRLGQPLEIKGAFKQQGPVVVVRTTDDLVFRAGDTFESGDVGDNIHPARHLGTSPFSSEGCHTIPGTYDRATGLHGGSWTDFRAAAGLSRTTAPPSEDGRRFSFALFTGRDARLVGFAPSPASAFTRLRFGSRGVDVGALQLGLSTAGFPHGGAANVMDAATTMAYVRWQQSVDAGRADAIVTPDDARALGFDLVTGRSIRPVPWRRQGTSVGPDIPDWLRPPAPVPMTSAPTTTTTTMTPTPTPSSIFTLTGSVGHGGQNHADDVTAVKTRLRSLGYSWVTTATAMDDDTIHAIKLFQSIVASSNNVIGDGRIDVSSRAGSTYDWLQADNAPRWQLMPAGSPAQGFRNFELEDLSEQFDYGTDWLADVIRAAAAHYRDGYLRDNPRAPLLTVNDVSQPQGGNAPGHAGHQCGLACDLRLPRLDGAAGGINYTDAEFDRDTTRAVIRSLHAQPLVSAVFFNDPTLIAEGLCVAQPKHDNHVHFQIVAPARSPANRP